MEGPACQAGWMQHSPVDGGTAVDLKKIPVPLCRGEGVTGETMGFLRKVTYRFHNWKVRM